MIPDVNVVTAGRSYALDNLPRILHILQDICGQGMILRWSEKDLETPAAFGKNLGWFLDTRNMSARDKNLVMNLVWDVAASEHATRSKLFEESNALNVPFLKERLYGEYDRSKFLRGVPPLHRPRPGARADVHAAHPGAVALVRVEHQGRRPASRRPARRHAAERGRSMSDEQARRVYDAARLGQRSRSGSARRCWSWTSPAGSPTRRARRLRPLGCRRGDRRLLASPRGNWASPVIFTTIAFEGSLADGGLWLQKIPALADLQIGGPWVEIDPRLERRDDETVVRQEGRVGLLRHEPHGDPRLPGDRHRRAVRRDHERVRARHRDRPVQNGFPAARAARVRGRPGAGAARRQPLRHPGKVRRRHRPRGRRGYLSAYRPPSSRGRNIQ